MVIIARTLRLSLIIPMMPSIKATGNETIISNPARAAIGLPQPGWIKARATNVAKGMIAKIADIFPKRIRLSLPKGLLYFDYIGLINPSQLN